MKQRWEIKSIDLSFYATTNEENKKRLEEITEVLYQYFCQLEKDKSQLTDTTVCVPTCENQNQERTQDRCLKTN